MKFSRRFDDSSDGLFSTLLPALDPTFNPITEIPNLALYLDSDLSPQWQDSARTTPAVLEDPGGAWDDLSGNARHLTQSVSTRRYQRKGNIFGTASGNYFTSDDALDLLSGLYADTGGSWWFVFKPTSIDGSTYRRILSARIAVNYDYNQANSYTFSAGPTSGQYLAMTARTDLGGGQGINVGKSYVNSTAYLLEAHYASGTATFLANGVSSSDTYTISDTFTPFYMTLGAQRVAGPAYQEFITGYYGLVAHSTTIASPTVQAKMRAYINSRFGL